MQPKPTTGVALMSISGGPGVGSGRWEGWRPRLVWEQQCGNQLHHSLAKANAPPGPGGVLVRAELRGSVYYSGTQRIWV